MRLEKALGLHDGVHIYFKNESVTPTGSHKVNTALAQVYYAQKEGVQRLTTETGAGQWGTALAYATALVKIPLTVYWVRAVYNWKADRKALMKMYGAEVYASPSNNTKCGKALCDKDPNDPGSLGIAVSEGIEDALTHENSRYSLGSVLTHVLLHQTIIGLETKLQLQKVGVEYPDMMISCLGGGSNFGGFTLPMLGDRCRKRCETQFLAAQSEVAHNLTGEYKYDYGDHAEQTPLMKMTTLGHQTRMDPIRGDGLRYHAAAPLLSVLRNQGLIDSVAYPKDEKHVFDCAELFTRTEGFLPAPESAYSVTAAIDEARKCKKTGEKKVIAFNISGHGFLDMVGYIEKLGIK